MAPFEAGLAVKSHGAHAVTEFSTANGPADYALVVGGRVLGIVEAKKVTSGATSSRILALNPHRRFPTDCMVR